jgi:hypothetical protein
MARSQIAACGAANSRGSLAQENPSFKKPLPDQSFASHQPVVMQHDDKTAVGHFMRTERLPVTELPNPHTAENSL